MLIIKNAHLVNPANNADSITDILIEDNKIKEINKNINAKDADVIDAESAYVFPGFIDLHVHLRDPGQTHKEDIITGSNAAAKGGYTSVLCMPNTTPVCDNVETVKYIIDKAKNAKTNVYPVASITKGMEGNELTDIKALVNAGAIAISEDGKSVMNARLLREAMVIAKELNIPVLSHCEDANLAGGVMNEGKRSKELGLPGIEENIEDIIAIRDILLAKETGVKLHLCHNSTKNSLSFIRMAKEWGVNISAEVCPHHFTLTDEDIPNREASEYKMSPPLRSKETVDILKTGLSAGIYNVIATDHAPHTQDEKAKGILEGPNGIVGLETAASLTYTVLVRNGLLSPMQMADRMSYSPSRVVNLDRGDISVGKIADIVIFNPNIEYTVSKEDLVSKSKNMPYGGMKLWGKVTHTILDGKVVYRQ